MITNYSELLDYYQTISAGEKYIAFSKGLVPNAYPMIGVKTPDIKKTAKLIANQNIHIIKDFPFNVFHEVDATIFLATIYEKNNLNSKLEKLWDLLPYLNNWAICDITCCALKIKEIDSPILFSFIEKCIATQKEYFVRFGIVLCLSNLITEEYIDKIFNLLNTIEYGPYYINMGVAWLLSICYIKHKEKTHLFLFKNSNLPSIVLKMTIQKCLDSYRITLEDKEILKTLRKKF